MNESTENQANDVDEAETGSETVTLIDKINRCYRLNSTLDLYFRTHFSAKSV